MTETTPQEQIAAWRKVPTAELLDRAVEVALQVRSGDDEEGWTAVRELHSRGGADVFAAATAWCGSSEPLLRCLGADVLGQLGFDDAHPFADESEPILDALLADREACVVSAALGAFGHLGYLGVGDVRAICALARHDAVDVREAVAYCLGTQDEGRSWKTLVALSRDPDTEVRNGATFSLGTLCELDRPEIRNALAARLSDTDFEVRGEAMLGLAVRGDGRAIPFVLKELKSAEVPVLALEAAAELPDPIFVPELEALAESDPECSEVRVALERCRES